MKKSLKEHLRITMWLTVISILGVILIDTQAIEWAELAFE